jgi:hypothetical protein
MDPFSKIFYVNIHYEDCTDHRNFSWTKYVAVSGTKGAGMNTSIKVHTLRPRCRLIFSLPVFLNEGN